MAGEYGNISMMKLILKGGLLSADERNKQEDTVLMHTLKTTNSEHFTENILMLASRVPDM